jgi:hypothetical protein
MGKVVPKQHIAFVFEEAKASKTDSILQSFLGRMCGHGPFSEDMPLIFVPSCFFTEGRSGFSELERYLRFADGEIITPAKAACIGKMPAVSGRLTLEPKRIPFMDEDPEDYGEAAAVADARPQSHVAYAEKARAYLALHPYSDPVQQEEALERLRTPSSIELHNFQAETYGYVRDPRKGIQSCLNRGTRWEDHWNSDKHFKVYWKAGEFYLAGYTERSGRETEMECRAAIVPTTKKEAWNPCNDVERVVQHPVQLVTRPDELETLDLTRPGQHVLFVHQSLRGHPGREALFGRASSGRGGRQWPREETARREEFDRLVLLIEVTIRIHAFVV